MKKSLLLIAALMILAAGAMAQNVYLGVTRTNGEYKALDVVKNNTVLFTHELSSYNFEMTDIIAADNGDVYYLNHCTGSTEYTDLYKLTANGQRPRIYDCPTGKGINLQDIAYDNVNGDVYACGSYYNSDGGRDYPYITKNDERLYWREEWDDYDCKFMGMTVINGNIFFCGGEASSAGGGGEDYSYAKVWKWNGTEPVEIASTYSTGLYSYAYDMVAYNGYLYICGKIKEDGVWKAVVWGCYPSSTNQTLQRIATISDSESYCTSMAVDAGSIYVSYLISGISTAVWKYNTITDYTDETFCSYSAPNATKGNIVANYHGVYTTANGSSRYYLNGNTVTTSVEGTVSKIAVSPTKAYQAYDMPFEDHFDDDYSYYDDWFAYDWDEENGYYPSYWDRYEYDDEEYAISHRWGCDEYQEGDLVSPAIRIPAGYSAKLRFYTIVEDLDDLVKSEIYVMEGIGEVLTTNNYGSIPQQNQVKVWDMADHVSDLEEDAWDQFDVDLSDWAGKTINIIFYYAGNCASRWTVDDIEVFGQEITAVKEIAEEVELSVMPNPASDIISISGLDGIEEVNIYNTLGQIVKTVNVSDGEMISVEELSSGVYMIKTEKSTQTVKFVVE